MDENKQENLSADIADTAMELPTVKMGSMKYDRLSQMGSNAENNAENSKEMLKVCSASFMRENKTEDLGSVGASCMNISKIVNASGFTNI